ncbi:MAG: PAS domain-containing sensor histidine kinase [Chloroflexi bacterium]|nr:PAS domain-containing sensor histidine kinase [Chloroflexota bacterium]
MSLSPINLDPLFLAARVAQAYNKTHNLAYAHISPDFKFLQISPNFGSLLQTTSAEVIGQTITDVLWEFVGAEETLQAVLNGTLPDFRIDQINRQQSDGSIIYFTFSVTPVQDQHPTNGLLLLVEDTTAYGRLQQTIIQDRNELRLLQKQLAQSNEELAHVSRLKSLFLSIAAHELQTPLAAIYMYSNMLIQKEIPVTEDKKHDYIDIVRMQANRLGRLVTDFLDLEQIEQGQFSIHPMECNLNDLLEETLSILQVEAKKRQIDLTVDLPDTPTLLWADSEKILQILYNLIGNALKYTLTDGNVHIQVMQTETAVTLHIKDTGLGMTQEQVDSLFTLLYRAHGQNNPHIRGNGLGLFIVKSLVEAHGGTISVKSKPQKGSTFTIEFPAIEFAQQQYQEEIAKKIETDS